MTSTAYKPCEFHPYQIGEASGGEMFRRVFVGTFGESHLRFVYLTRMRHSGEFRLDDYYGAGSAALGLGNAEECLAFWDAREACQDLCQEVRKAMAEWPKA
jgi:hypothetical protein